MEEINNSKIICEQCKRKFSNSSNLKMHVKKFHPNEEEYFKSLQVQNNKDYDFCCNYCCKRFTYKKHLRFHMKTHGEQQLSSDLNINNNIINCSLCKNFSGNKTIVMAHYASFHEISIKIKQILFESNEEFLTWKNNFKVCEAIFKSA